MPEQTRLTVVLWMDRHSDPGVYLFTDRAVAEEWARTQGRDFDRHGDYREKTYDSGELKISYSPEGDDLSVKDLVVDFAAPQEEGQAHSTWTSEGGQ